jgi:hypothetical protein
MLIVLPILASAELLFEYSAGIARINAAMFDVPSPKHYMATDEYPVNLGIERKAIEKVAKFNAQFRRYSFVGIDMTDPFIGKRQVGLCPISLPGIILKWVSENVVRVLGHNVQRTISAAGIHNENLICPIHDGIQTRADVGFLVVRHNYD